MSTSFAENLKAVRLKAGLKQAELSKKAHLPQPAVSQLENAVRPPTPRVMKMLCDALGVDQSVLTGTESAFSKEKAELLHLINRMGDKEAGELVIYIKAKGSASIPYSIVDPAADTLQEIK